MKGDVVVHGGRYQPVKGDVVVHGGRYPEPWILVPENTQYEDST